jgi:multimeric flavodoxin WrbA
MTLKAIALNGTLKASDGDPSSTDRMLELIADAMLELGVETETIRLADHNIKPGVTSDEGPGDA